MAHVHPGDTVYVRCRHLPKRRIMYLLSCYVNSRIGHGGRIEEGRSVSHGYPLGLWILHNRYDGCDVSCSQVDVEGTVRQEGRQVVRSHAQWKRWQG